MGTVSSVEVVVTVYANVLAFAVLVTTVVVSGAERSESRQFEFG